MFQVRILNEKWHNERKGAEDVAIVLGMDGFHYYRKELDAMPDPVESHRRRGAPFTFNVKKFKETVQRLKQSDERILAPSFDHSVKDPVEQDICIEPHHRIIVIEGNYILLDEPYWRDIAGMFDSTWLVTLPRQSARKRLSRRHVASGVAISEQEALERVDCNDLPNGDLAMSHLVGKPSVIIDNGQDISF